MRAAASMPSRGRETFRATARKVFVTESPSRLENKKRPDACVGIARTRSELLYARSIASARFRGNEEAPKTPPSPIPLTGQ